MRKGPTRTARMEHGVRAVSCIAFHPHNEQAPMKEAKGAQPLPMRFKGARSGCYSTCVGSAWYLEGILHEASTCSMRVSLESR